MMNKDVAISVQNVTMSFNLNKEKVDNLKEYAIKFFTRKLEYKKFHALNNISFEVKKGERLAILGFNGAGKSTLLKTIVGVYKPSEGTVERCGVIAPLLELGAGFDPNYTGKENIYLYGAILGYSREYINSKYKEIVDFSELGHFIDVPLKNYSSGMKARLGFSIATAVEPDVLILDEVLSVGDAKFREKSLKKVQSMFDSGVTVLFVSHNINQVKQICDKAILLNHGEIIANGNANEVCKLYNKMTKLDRTDEKLVKKEIAKFKVEQRKNQLEKEAKAAIAASEPVSVMAVQAAQEKPVKVVSIPDGDSAPMAKAISEKAAAKKNAPVKETSKPEVKTDIKTETKADKPTTEQIVAELLQQKNANPNQRHIDIPKKERKFDESKFASAFVDVYSSSQTAASNAAVEEPDEEKAPKQSRASIQFANMQNRTIQPGSKPVQRKLGVNRPSYTNSAATHSGIGKNELEEIIKSFSK